MEFKKVCVYGFEQNAYLFMQPAIRYVLGNIKTSRVTSLEEIRDKPRECDVFAVNCAMAFYDLELFFRAVSDGYKDSKPIIFCVAWEGVPQENLDIMLSHNSDLIMFDLKNEDEFSFCREAYLSGKNFRSQGTFNRGEEFYCDRVDTYYTLSKNQKYAFLYMMTGKTQKELKVDFGFNSLNTAASHWHAVLKKFNVQSVFELRAMFR